MRNVTKTIAKNLNPGDYLINTPETFEIAVVIRNVGSIEVQNASGSIIYRLANNSQMEIIAGDYVREDDTNELYRNDRMDYIDENGFDYADRIMGRDRVGFNGYTGD